MDGKIKVEKEQIPYTRVPNSVLRDKKISWKAKGLYSFLIGIGDDWVIHKSQIAKASKDGYDSMVSAWKELELLGYIEQKQVREDGKFVGYEYFVRRSPIRENPEPVPIRENPELLKNLFSDTIDSKLNPNNLRTRTLEKQFEKFWNLYDKKEDRKKTEDKFKKLKDSEIEKIYPAVERYKKYQPDRKFRKNPLTWLNGRCWEDEYEIEDKTKNEIEPTHEFSRDNFYSAFLPES